MAAKMTPARRLEIDKAQLDANHPKDLLMALVRRLDRNGATRHAMSLDRIVARLEAWQNWS
jgi:hypothetical protein